MNKILYVTTISGFLPQFEMNDVRIMQQMGYEVHYASNFANQMYTFDEKELAADGIILHHIDIEKKPTRVFREFKAIRQIKRIIEEENISIVHCHNPMGGVCARIAAHHSSNRPYVIYTGHGLHFYKGAPAANWLFYYPVEKLMARMSDVIVTINREDYDTVKNRFKLKKGGYAEQIPGVGLDMDRFDVRKELAARVREELHVPQGAFHIVTAAELNGNKNQQAVIEAVAGLPQKDIYYTICGRGADEEKLRGLIGRLGLSDRVRLIGFRTDMERVLQSADVFAFPSMREGLGMAAVEALACGVPVICADNRGTREYVKDGVNGIVCSENSAGCMRAALARLYGDREYLLRLAGQCRDSVRRFGTDNTMKIMKQVYTTADKAVGKAQKDGRC